MSLRSECGKQREDSTALGCDDYLLLGLEGSPHPGAQGKPCLPGPDSQEDPAAGICVHAQLSGSACLGLCSSPWWMALPGLIDLMCLRHISSQN